MPEALDAGWGWPLLARKAHFFEADSSTSVCGRWLYTGPREPEVAGRTSPDDCVACRRHLEKRGQ